MSDYSRFLARHAKRASSFFTLLPAMALLSVAGAFALAPDSDSARGEQVLRRSGCDRCHALGTTESGNAPNLATPIARGYTPGFVAAVIWNHGPAAWTRPGGESAGVRGDGEAADLFAFFVSRYHFERRGSAKRGKEFYQEEGCSGCHGATETLTGSGPEGARWEFVRDPIASAQRIWNSSVTMQEAAAENRDARLPRATAEDLRDLFLYLGNLPQNRGGEPHLSLASGEDVSGIFDEKGCGECHQGPPVIESGSVRFTLADVTAALWNHAFRNVDDRQTLSYDEMSSVIGYVWAANTGGSPDRGQRVFSRIGCTDCHNAGSGGIESAKHHFAEDCDVSAAIVDVIWEHGPAMHAEMQRNNIGWPRLSETQAADLGSFLKTAADRARP